MKQYYQFVIKKLNKLSIFKIPINTLFTYRKMIFLFIKS